jgi:hypothetical protein
MIHLDTLREGRKAPSAPQPSGDASLLQAVSGERPSIIHGEPSYTLHNREVELAVTRRGGHLAPVRFRLGRRWAQPYALAPWLPDGIAPSMPPVLQVLRGDYFCLPFGGGKGVEHVHGETANGDWELVESGSGRLVLEMAVKFPACRVRKILSIRQGQRAVYQEHRISGLRGRYNFGHHAVLQFPEGGPFHVSVSPFRFGQVKPELFSNPLHREYGALKTGARFRSLDQVPLATGGTTSLAEYPARQGFEDLVLMAAKPGDFAWTAATLDGYVWIALKDPRVLPSTLFWISNGGRHGEPWNGRHLRRLGLEEICGHFSDGLEISRQDRLKGEGIPTTALFRAREVKSVKVIHVVHPVPAGFGRVEAVERDPGGSSITVRAGNRRVTIPVDWNFLHG